MSTITDRSIVPYPATPPELGPAGSVLVEPFADNRLLRVTDANTNPASPGASYTTPSSGANNPWACDSRHFVIADKAGAYLLYRFDPETFTIESLGRVKQNFRGCWFSAQDPNLLFGVTGELRFYGLNIETGKNLTLVDFEDYAEELHIPLPPERWYLNALSVGWWDDRISAMLGPGQDKSWLAVVWDRREGLIWLDTNTGEIGGWRSGNIQPWSPFLLHWQGLSRSAQTLMVGSTTSGDVRTWKVGTTIFTRYTASETIPTWGHNVMGFETFFGLGAGGPFNWIQAAIADLGRYEPLLAEPVTGEKGWWSDFHMSCQPEGHDRQPLFVSTENVQGNPKTPGTPLTSKAPGDNEIIAVAADGTGRWWRLAHTYATGKNDNFYSKPRGNISLDGKFFMFTSDWEVTLGGVFPQQRTDVFILEVPELT